MRREIKIWMCVFCSIVILAILSVVAFDYFYKKDTRDSVLGVNSINYTSVPYVSSVPMQYLYIGELFKYVVEVSDLDTNLSDIDIFLTQKPQWMYIEGNEVRGIPLDEGTFKYVITVCDGVNCSSQVNYVLVENYE